MTSIARRLALTLPLAALARCAAPPPPPPPPVALPLRDAVAQLASAIVNRARLPPPGPGGKYPIVIDPWIDRATGAQIVTTQLMQAQILALAPASFPMLELLPFTTASLARQPLVLLGAITGVAGPGSLQPVRGEPAAYRIYGVLADLRSGLVVANESAWVLPGQVDATPTAFFRDSPAWAPEPITAAYLRTVAAPPGAPMDTAYRDGLLAQALVSDATTAYQESRYAQALALYQAASQLPEGGDQLRVFNGLYLTNRALQRRAEALQAFQRIVAFGLRQDRLALKFLFSPGSTAFWPDPQVSGDYPLWLRTLGRQLAGGRSCLELSGHASATGNTAQNDRIALLRARHVRALLLEQSPLLAGRVSLRIAGARENLVGNGRDDASDALDRRVELRLRSCAVRAGEETSPAG